MTRRSKQSRERSVSYRRPLPPFTKSGPKRDQLPQGYRPHLNAVPDEAAALRFIPKS